MKIVVFPRRPLCARWNWDVILSLLVGAALAVVLDHLGLLAWPTTETARTLQGFLR